MVGIGGLPKTRLASDPVSKQNTILRNLKALTGKASIASASKVLEPVERIEVSGESSLVSCELCGTRFGVGAWVSRPRTVKRIAVGGTCLKSVVLGRFGDAKAVRAKRREVRRTLELAYRGAIDPGGWITWVIANAPRRFGRQVVELEVVGALRKKADLQALIDFHDSKRKFPFEAFFHDAPDLRRLLAAPDSITINDALALRKSVTADMAREVAKRTVVRLGGEQFSEWLRKSDPSVVATYQRLSESGKATVKALVGLHRVLPGEPGAICPVDLFEQWPPVRLPLMEDAFLWHPYRHGLAYVDADGEEITMTRPWLWATGGYSDDPIGLRGWLDVNGAPEAAIAELRNLAAIHLAEQGQSNSESESAYLADVLRT